MRLPNGYGTVYKLPGNRRRPWVAAKTTGWADDGKQIQKPIGYYVKREEALKALAEYNNAPYNLDAAKITFAQVYEIWSQKRFEKIAKSNCNGYKAAYASVPLLHSMRFADIKTDHLQDALDEAEKEFDSRRKIKTLFNQMYEYAMANDIIGKDYADYVKIGERDSEVIKIPFTEKEIDILWENVDRLEDIDTVLILIYTGLRPGELIKIETEKINLDERYMRGGIKTAAGKDRVIPIHKRIDPLIRARLGHKYLVVNAQGEQMSYFNYYQDRWKLIMEQLQLNHKPHECRHTCATRLDNAGANKVSIKRILGHASKDITDKVYTHKDIEELIKAIDLLR